MGGVFSACCGARNDRASQEPLLLDSEREAVADLLQYLEQCVPSPSTELTAPAGARPTSSWAIRCGR